jgi:hypothetical protein
MLEVSVSRSLRLPWSPCLKLPFLLSLRFIVAEAVHGEVVLRETRVNIAEPARLRSATRCTTN